MVKTASEVYSIATGSKCEGDERCYYCNAPCDRTTPHPEPPPMIGQRGGVKTPALNPGGAYMCKGCQAWRRPKITAPYLGGGFKDSQTARNHNWYVTPGGAWAVMSGKQEHLYTRLLNPPPVFVLMLTDGSVPNMLQLGKVNLNPEIKAETELHFTINNVAFTYTVYDLMQAGRGETQGLSPGVQALVKLYGPPPSGMLPKEEVVQPEPRKKGRPSHSEPRDPRTANPGKVIRQSGIISV